MVTEKSVHDGKLTNDQLGGLTRRNNEIIRRTNDGTLTYEDVMALLQKFVIEVKPEYLGIIKGTHEIKAIEHCIDCDTTPMIPNGCSVEEYQKGGMLQFDITKISLYLSRKQKNGSIKGNKLCEELKDKKVLNANVLDYLLVNPHLIPEEWKRKAVFFWGTIYRDSDGNLFVRYLDWSGTRWYWGNYWLSSDFNADDPAAVLAS
jgi:hypothetical protein